jgi:hypothetical protein
MKLLMLDSGAFSVWMRGRTIDLSSYIRFCTQHPDISYYVSLDVIPGKFGDKTTIRSKEAINESCKRGWLNYKTIIQEIPKDKVIPVFHQNEDIKWLDKYLNFGVPYIGISPANDMAVKSSTSYGQGFLFYNTTTKISWMRSLKKLIFDTAGRPLVKTHGFAVTSYDLMKEWEWFSVDSATWQFRGVLGDIWMPKLVGGNYDFSVSPITVTVSQRSPALSKFALQKSDTKSALKDQILDWIKQAGVAYGENQTFEVKADYKPNKSKGERWWNKKKRICQKVIKEGISNSAHERIKVNLYYMRKAAIALRPWVPNIFYAGIPMEEFEMKLNKRLLSFSILEESKAARRVFQKHIKRIKETICE